MKSDMIATTRKVRSLSRVRAGLSHMAEHGEEEAVVPAAALDFSTYGGGTKAYRRMLSASLRQSSREVVHSRPVAVLVEVDVEHPAARTVGTVCTAIGELLNPFTPDECANYLKNSGYQPNVLALLARSTAARRNVSFSSR
jgi:hypothetical protein